MNPMTDIRHDIHTVEEVVGDFDLSCDFYVDGKVLCQGDPAHWVMYRTPCCGTSASTPALACDTCKEARVLNMISLECHWCGKVWESSVDAYSMIEKLDRSKV